MGEESVVGSRPGEVEWDPFERDRLRDAQTGGDGVVDGVVGDDVDVVGDGVVDDVVGDGVVPEPEPTTSTVPEPEPTTPEPTTTSTVPPRCGAGEHAHNPEFGSGVHPRWVKDTQAHRDAHGGGDTPTGCHGDHAPLVRVLIEDYAGSTRSGPGTMTATFAVTPADARCSALLLGRIANRASISPRTGSGRTVTVEAAAVGDLKVYVHCTHATLEPSTKGADFAVLDAACIQDITIGAQTTELPDQQWTACASSQRGKPGQTPHYAEHYVFELGAAATVTIELSSATDAYLYLLPGRYTPGATVTPLSQHHNGTRSGKRTARIEQRLDPGTYTIEATTRAERTGGSFDLTVTATQATTATSTPKRFKYTNAMVDGVLSASSGAVAAARSGPDDDLRACVNRATDPVTANELAAYMLAIPLRELRRENPSLMDLSRWDSVFQNLKSRHLFSRGTQNGEPTAHWSPGVGPWQMDWNWRVKSKNHAERASVAIVAPMIANHLLPGLCGKQSLRMTLDTWHACEGDKHSGEDPEHDYCPDLAAEIYDEENDSLWIQRVPGSDVDGGVQDRKCRWGTDGGEFDCHWYDIANAEGDPTVYLRAGTKSPCPKKYSGDESVADDGLCYSATPLPSGFVSFTDTDGTKYAAFPAADIGEAGTGTGYSATLIRGVPADKYARDSTLGDGHGWFEGTVNNRVLYIKTCAATVSCRWYQV